MTTVAVTPARLPRPVIELCIELRNAGHRAWVVGGCVRDLLFGKDVGDWDLCTSATPIEVQKVFRRVIPTGIDHGTVTVLWKGGSYEVTTLRGEGAYSDGRRPDSVHFVSSIDDDLARRDFTINAIAYDPIDDVLIDPFHGIADMESRTLRAVGNAIDRFREDGLRVLRAARFTATLNVAIEPSTFDAIGATLDTFRKVSPERVRDEWLKTMKAKKPSQAFRVMEKTGMLAAISPELAKQAGCEQNKYHAFDVWEHSLETLDALEGDPVLRVAGLLHDIGKPATRELSEKTGDFTFYHHEAVGAKMADTFLREFRFSNDERERVVHLVRHHLVCYTEEWSDAAVRRFIKRIGKDKLADQLALARADSLAKGVPAEEQLLGLLRLRERIEAENAAGNGTSLRELNVTGDVLMKELSLRPSKQIGVILNQLLEHVLDVPTDNHRDKLIELARGLANHENKA